jgi:hypothetical protein
MSVRYSAVGLAAAAILIGGLGAWLTFRGQAPEAHAAKVLYRPSPGTRIGGGLLLKPGDRVVCKNPGRWLAVTLDDPDSHDLIQAESSLQTLRGRVVLRVTKNVRTGYGTISCARLAQ